MSVIRVQLHRDKIRTLPYHERTFFFSLGHTANEINTITKLLFWSAKNSISNEAVEHGQYTLMLFLIRILAGKLNEAWEFFRGSFFGTALSKTYDTKLSGKPAEAIRSLKDYFNSHNSAHLIRNRFAFHYSPEDLDKMLPYMDEQLDLYLEKEAAPNNLFFFAEKLVCDALLAMLHEEIKEMTMIDLVDELFKVSQWFAIVSDGLMDAIIDTHGEELRAKPPEEVQFDELRDFKSIEIPWFSDTRSAINSLKDTA